MYAECEFSYTKKCVTFIKGNWQITPTSNIILSKQMYLDRMKTCDCHPVGLVKGAYDGDPQAQLPPNDNEGDILQKTCVHPPRTHAVAMGC